MKGYSWPRGTAFTNVMKSVFVCSFVVVFAIPNEAFGAPNDFDGDGSSDFIVARTKQIDTCSAVLAAPWANCTSNLNLVQYTWFSKSSSASGLTDIRSLVSSNETSKDSSYVQDPTSTKAVSDSSGTHIEPRLITYLDFDRYLAHENISPEIEYVQKNKSGRYRASGDPFWINVPMFSHRQLVEHFAGEEENANYQMLDVQDFRYRYKYDEQYYESSSVVQVFRLISDGIFSTLFNIPNLADEELPFTRVILEEGVPVVADYNGDGLDEIAVFDRGANWIIRDIYTGSEQKIQWGLPGDHPMPGDYDGDGSADLVVFRPSNAYWYILTSSSGYDVAQAVITQFGLPTSHTIGELIYYNPVDLPVKGDFDGDGRLDLAVYRIATGTWYYLSSRNNSVVATQWGLPSDLPVGIGIVTKLTYLHRLRYPF